MIDFFNLNRTNFRNVKSLKAQHHALANPERELQIIENELPAGLTSFNQHLKEIDLFPLLPTGLEIFQMNLGKMCNQVCKHCHVDAGR